MNPPAVAVITFVVGVILLWIYAARHWGKRRQALEVLMPSLGYSSIEEPSSDDLLPNLLFHPNGFESTRKSGVGSDWLELQPRIPMAWKGRAGKRSVTVMDVSISRRQKLGGKAQHRDSTRQLSVTLIRCDPGTTIRPPDFLIEERVLFKNKIKGQRSANGPEQIGQHYFVFSDASREQLEAWITPSLRDQLAQYRLWTVATHHGALYLARNRLEKPAEFSVFLQEGEALLAGLFANL